ncbi:uncharacterized protein LOC134839265 [Symsagittifera roscoffensis]|uniref:uncharacterized protein LOC134839265 n=1 Tax=Symsagittifera roscoffensis TaxID=84072 RepID=UPI00307CAE02
MYAPYADKIRSDQQSLHIKKLSVLVFCLTINFIPIMTSEPIEVLDLYLKQNSDGLMVFLLLPGQLKSELIKNVRSCTILVSQEKNSLEIVPFSISSSFPKEVSVSMDEDEVQSDSANELTPDSQKQRKLREKVSVSASCECNKPNNEESLTLTSNTVEVFPGLTEPSPMWALQPEDPEGNGSGGDSLGGYEGDDAELFSANEKLTLALVGAGMLFLSTVVILTVIILSRNNQLKCFQAQSVSQQELNTEDILADLRRIVNEQKAGQQRSSNI